MTNSHLALQFSMAWVAGLCIGGGIGFMFGEAIALHELSGLFGGAFGVAGAVCGTFLGPLVWLLKSRRKNSGSPDIR